MPARAIMFQGTGSDVGKSLIVAGLARAYTKRGLMVRPFKPQNMSNNAAVAGDGGERRAEGVGVEPAGEREGQALADDEVVAVGGERLEAVDAGLGEVEGGWQILEGEPVHRSGEAGKNLRLKPLDVDLD